MTQTIAMTALFLMGTGGLMFGIGEAMNAIDTARHPIAGHRRNTAAHAVQSLMLLALGTLALTIVLTMLGGFNGFS